MAVALAEVDRSIGQAIFGSVLSSQAWIHRKVETLRMLDDDAGRRNVSIDCTPPRDGRLRTRPQAGPLGNPAESQVYLPIAILSKVQIRDLDLRDDRGGAVPMAERGTFEWLEVSAIVAEIEQKGNSISDGLIADINAIVRSKPDRARVVASELLTGARRYEGFEIETLPHSLRRFIRDLAEGFLLVAVIDENRQGRRFVMKYSAYWPQPETVSPPLTRPFARLRHAIALYLRRVGWFPFHYLIDVSGAAFAASYHIQVHIPDGLAYDRMELPRRDGDSSRVDIDQGSIAHGGAHFDTSSTEDATLVLRNPSKGRLGSVVLVGLLTVVVLSAFAWTGLVAAIARNPADVESALGLLLLLPAGLIAIGSRNRDNRVSAAASAALRGTAQILAASYLALAVVLVVLSEDVEQRVLLHLILVVLWAVATAVTLPVVIGYIATRRREVHYRNFGDPDAVADYHAVKPRAGDFWSRIGVEDPIFRVSTVESGLTILGEVPSFDSQTYGAVKSSAREVTEVIANSYEADELRTAEPATRDLKMVGLAAAENAARAAGFDIIRKDTASLFNTLAVGSAPSLFVGHAKGRRDFPLTATIDNAITIAAPSGAIANPPSQWMTVVVVRGELIGYTDPKVPLKEFLKGVSERFSVPPAQLEILVPEGGINDRVVRLVSEFGARSVKPARAAVHSAIEVMTGTSSSQAFYGTVGSSEGMAIAAAARVLGAEMFGSFGSPDLLFASGGVGRYSGFYRASELINSSTVVLTIASRRETDTLASGMNFPSRAASGSESSIVVLGAESYPVDLVAKVRESTAAAAAAARLWIGKRDKNAVDAAAVAAMRQVLADAPFSGTVIIGEGEKDRAPMLANGEHLGNASAPECDIAVDPLDGTRLAAEGIPGSICVIALAPKNTMFKPTDVFYMDKIISSSLGIGVLDIRSSASKNVHAYASAKGVPVEQVVVVVLDKPRHAALIEEIRAIGAIVRLVGEGDVSAAVAAASVESDVDLVLGVGGTPEGIVAACAVRALGGFMQGRLAPQSDAQLAMAVAAGHDVDRILELGDLVSSDQVLFVSSPVL